MKYMVLICTAGDDPVSDADRDGAPDIDGWVEEMDAIEWPALVAGMIRLTGDWDLAEERAQDAFARALERWPTCHGCR